MKQRILTAVLALIIFIPLVIYGNWPFQLFIYIIATIGLLELLKMHKVPLFSFPSILATILLWVMLVPATDLTSVAERMNTAEIIMVFVLLLLAYTVLVKNKFSFDDAGFLLLAVLYVGMGFYYFLETRSVENGLATIFYVLLVVWATDTGAYFSGRALGKNKLWPEISPNKTIEGAIGGIVLATIVGVVFHLIFPLNQPIYIIVAVSILGSIFGQIGDLVESAYKRFYDVKDSGNILPGHGGILDRFDSLLFVFPVLHFIQFM
ncbi:phosphatidate cytidylyltransferase [Ornithinibacillus halophilus]|uniref:Phosphatidate cytidylyltransferase n=1 Tax=Ornithinibacillus halophilus TaxID=930117 RepID=A0A1M5CCB9_9BACI|nr:phosphatidate cytidylyltransferase [Ornithinibacillus halophilus]SHF52359.1 phosphatidate cytidylyltransferase [Ornithinibacillus halophilus]